MNKFPLLPDLCRQICPVFQMCFVAVSACDRHLVSHESILLDHRGVESMVLDC